MSDPVMKDVCSKLKPCECNVTACVVLTIVAGFLIWYCI